MKHLTKCVLAGTIAVSFNAHALNVIGLNQIVLVDQAVIQASENRSTAYTNQVLTEAKQIGAIGMASSAAAASANPTAFKRTAISTGVGYYQGYSALSLGVTHLIHDNIKLYGTVSGTQNGKQGGAVGASFSF